MISDTIKRSTTNFRGDVVGGSAERGCQVTVLHAVPAHAEVGQFAVALPVQQDVVQLDVPGNVSNVNFP